VIDRDRDLDHLVRRCLDRGLVLARVRAPVLSLPSAFGRDPET
jgi:hypothetical protein